MSFSIFDVEFVFHGTHNCFAYLFVNEGSKLFATQCMHIIGNKSVDT